MLNNMDWDLLSRIFVCFLNPLMVVFVSKTLRQTTWSLSDDYWVLIVTTINPHQTHQWECCITGVWHLIFLPLIWLRFGQPPCLSYRQNTGVLYLLLLSMWLEVAFIFCTNLFFNIGLSIFLVVKKQFP